MEQEIIYFLSSRTKKKKKKEKKGKEKLSLKKDKKIIFYFCESFHVLLPRRDNEKIY